MRQESEEEFETFRRGVVFRWLEVEPSTGGLPLSIVVVVGVADVRSLRNSATSPKGGQPNRRLTFAFDLELEFWSLSLNPLFSRCLLPSQASNVVCRE